MEDSINEAEKNKDKSNNRKRIICKKSAQNYLFNIIGYILNNKNNFKDEQLKAKDFDINLYTDSNISKIDNIIYDLKLINFSFNPKRDKIKNLRLYKDFPSELKINDEFYNNHYFDKIILEMLPTLHKHILLDISAFTFFHYDTTKKTIEKYNIEQKNNNNKLALYLYISNFQILKTETFLKVVDELKYIENIFDYFENIYIIFQVDTEDEAGEIIKSKDFNKYFVNDNENNGEKRIKFIFNIISTNDSNKEDVINIFNEKHSFGEEYYFILDQDNKIILIKEDFQSLIGRIILFILNFNKIRKTEKENYFQAFKEQKQKKNKERCNALFDIMGFISKLKDLDYLFDFEFVISFNASINEYLNDLDIRKINLINIKGEFRTEEFKFLKNILKPIRNKVIDHLKEMNTIDIDIDFNDMKCCKCSKIIPEDNFLYYCNICKTKYCYECVKDQLKKKGKEKFIDQKHNLLYFKTRNKKNFMNLDKNKFGNNRFAESTNDDDFNISHSAICNGCRGGFNRLERYVCINCRPGVYLSDGYIDYCSNCIEMMINNENEKKRLEGKAHAYISYDNNHFLSKHILENNHKHDEHIYLFLPLEYGNVSHPYNNY